VAALQASDEENYHLEKHQQQCMSLLFPKTQLCSKLEPKTPPPSQCKNQPWVCNRRMELIIIIVISTQQQQQQEQQQQILAGNLRKQEGLEDCRIKCFSTTPSDTQLPIEERHWISKPAREGKKSVQKIQACNSST
jgi:hypothetical protein